MSRFGLVGPSYTSESVNADCQLTQNMYVEHDESGAGKSEFQLYPRPGLSLFSVCGAGPLRQEINANKRSFQVSGDSLYEVFADGTNTLIGVVGNDGQPASMCNSSTQLAVVSSGQLYVYNLTTNTFIGAIDTGIGPVKMVGYSDGFFLCLISNSQKFQISSPLDATVWDPADVTQVSVFPDEILSMIVDHREVILHGVTKSVVYGNTGAADFPFSPIPSSYIEQGIAAAWCRDRLDNSEFWLGADDRGRLIANRLQGYNPVRISNHAVETEWQSYSTVEDAVSYSFQMNGHTFWHLSFPTASKTWVYDVATGLWHQWSYLNPQSGINEADLSICHTFVFGQHLVGDRRNGNVYVMNDRLVDDDGIPIQRVRRAPHISIEQEYMFHNQLQLDAECGLNPALPPLDIPFSVDHINAGPGNPLGNLGPLYVCAVVTYADGSRKISPIFGPINNGDQTYVRLFTPGIVTAIPGVISWRFYYWNTTDGPAYIVTLTSQQYAAIANIYLLNAISSYGPPIDWIGGFSGRDADGNGIPRNPIVWLSWSKDGGHNWSNEIEMYLGKGGDYGARCICRRLGRSRDRVFQIRYSDTAPLRIVDAYLKAAPGGFQPTPRLSDVARRQA